MRKRNLTTKWIAFNEDGLFVFTDYMFPTKREMIEELECAHDSEGNDTKILKRGVGRYEITVFGCDGCQHEYEMIRVDKKNIDFANKIVEGAM